MSQKTKSFLKIGHRFREYELSKLRGTKLSVLLSLSLHMNEYGHTYPSVGRIAHETGYSVSAVKRAVKWLRNKGYATLQDNPGIRSNTYLISYPNIGHHMVTSSSVVDELGVVYEPIKRSEGVTSGPHEGVASDPPPTHRRGSAVDPKEDKQVDTTKEDNVVVRLDVKPKDISQELWNYSLMKCKGPNTVAYARGVLKRNPFWKPDKKTVDPDSPERRASYLEGVEVEGEEGETISER